MSHYAAPLVAMVACVACTSDSPRLRDNFRTEYAEAFCERQNACCGTDVGACQMRQLMITYEASQAPDVMFDDDAAELCLKAIKSADCRFDDGQFEQWVRECRFVFQGTRGPGDACATAEGCYGPDVTYASCMRAHAGTDDVLRCHVTYRAKEGEACPVSAGDGFVAYSCEPDACAEREGDQGVCSQTLEAEALFNRRRL